jgi:hypothetical protein
LRTLLLTSRLCSMPLLISTTSRSMTIRLQVTFLAHLWNTGHRWHPSCVQFLMIFRAQ